MTNKEYIKRLDEANMEWYRKQYPTMAVVENGLDGLADRMKWAEYQDGLGEFARIRREVEDDRRYLNMLKKEYAEKEVAA